MNRIVFLMLNPSLFNFFPKISQLFMVCEYKQCLQRADGGNNRDCQFIYTSQATAWMSYTDFACTRQHFGEVRLLTTRRRATDCQGNRKSCNQLSLFEFRFRFKTVTSFFAPGVKIPNVPLASWPPV